MYERFRASVVDAIAHRPHAFTVCLALLVTSVLLIYNGLADIPDSPSTGAEPVLVACLVAGALGLPLAIGIWFGDVNDARALEGVMVLGLSVALAATIWAEYRWPDHASGTLGYAMLILLASGAVLRNEFVLGAFLLAGTVAWFVAEGSAPRASDLPPDNRTLILASVAIGIAFHVSLRFERHVQGDLTRQLVDRINNDTLTGVLSREGMLQLTSDRTVPEAHTWCLYADVDYFKSINDEFGHDRGDQVLRAVSDAISRTLGPDARVAARWGGDEFVVISEGEPPAEDEIERRINRELESVPASPRVTVGVAMLPAGEDRAVTGGTDGPTWPIDVLVKASDQRMYARRNRIRADGGPSGSDQTGRELPGGRNEGRPSEFQE